MPRPRRSGRPRRVSRDGRRRARRSGRSCPGRRLTRRVPSPPVSAPTSAASPAATVEQPAGPGRRAGAPHGRDRPFPSAALPELRLIEQALRLPKLLDRGAQRTLPDPAPGLGQRQPRVVLDHRGREQQIGAGDAVVRAGPLAWISRATAPQSSARA